MADYNENNGYLPFPKGFATAAIHTSQEPEKWDSMAVVPPLVTATTFQRYDVKTFKNYEYGRYQNPTREVLENVLATLDNGKYGLTFSSGLGAVSSLLYLLKTGENVIVGSDIYGGTHYLVNKVAENFKIDVTFVDLTDIEQLKKAIKPNTKMILGESPTNPTLKVIDLKAVAYVAKTRGVFFVVDNTFLTPYLQRPIDFGADLVLYSLTKYLNGHSDVLMGAITTANKELYDKIKNIQMFVGSVPSPFDCYQVIRSVKTLSLRMRQHSKNGLAVAQFLEKHPKIKQVLHPGLKSHMQHELFKKQTCGHSGVFSFYLKASPQETEEFAKNLKWFKLAHSLGGVDSLIMIPYHGSHQYVEHDIKLKMGITESFVRLSIGLEDIDDLIDDLDQALQKL